MAENEENHQDSKVPEELTNDQPSETHSPINQSYNPSISDEIPLEDIEKVKGDAIGDTLYSSRFVLKTLINLTNVTEKLEDREDFEKDLCTLWDMTIEKDVIKLLLEHSVLDLFSDLIDASEDVRLIEILIGIIGNMCSCVETRNYLSVHPNIMASLINQIGTSDRLILMQLMRFIQSAVVFEISGDELLWFEHFQHSEQFIQKFAFILSNSMSKTLLWQSYEALNVICTMFTVVELNRTDSEPNLLDFIIVPELISGIMEAFHQMIPESLVDVGNEPPDDTGTPTERNQRIMNLFLDINVMLSQYGTKSRTCFEPFMSDILKCSAYILGILSHPIYLLPVTTNEQGFIENVNELIQELGDPFDSKCFERMIRIWSLIETDKVKSMKTGWDDSTDGVNPDDLTMTILEFITRTSGSGGVEDIRKSIRSLDAERITLLYRSLEAGSGEPDIRDCCRKLKEAIRLEWDEILPEIDKVAVEDE